MPITVPGSLLGAAPTPSPAVDPNAVTPGLVGFAVFAVIAVVSILLILDMVRRIRRVDARFRARERIAAELRRPPVPDDDGDRRGGRPDAG